MNDDVVHDVVQDEDDDDEDDDDDDDEGGDGPARSCKKRGFEARG